MLGFVGLNKPKKRTIPKLSAPVYQGFFATGGKVNSTFSSGTKYYNSRTPHIARSTVTRVKVPIANWCSDYSGEIVSGGSATYTASIEYPAGTYSQVTFSGSTSGVAANGTTIISDWCNVNIPEGAKFWVREFGNMPSGIFYTPLDSTYDVGNQDTANGQQAEFASSAIADKTMGGTISTTYAPYAIYTLGVVAEITKPSVLIIGDSISFGASDSYDGTISAIGEVERSLYPYFGYANMGSYGEQASNFASKGSRRAALAQWCSHVVQEYGVNDIGIGSITSESALRTLLNANLNRSEFAGKKTHQLTLTPRSSSTDSYATKANQTVTANFTTGGTVSLINTSIRAGLVGNSPCIDLIAGAFDAADNKWFVDGTANKYTKDGTHPVQFAYKAMAALFNSTLITR